MAATPSPPPWGNSMISIGISSRGWGAAQCPTPPVFAATSATVAVFRCDSMRWVLRLDPKRVCCETQKSSATPKSMILIESCGDAAFSGDGDGGVMPHPETPYIFIILYLYEYYLPAFGATRRSRWDFCCGNGRFRKNVPFNGSYL